jgi:uncharacterized protein YndB with AHSA1/START domain
MKPDTSSTLTINRSFDASPRRVFDAWTNPDSRTGWWGPKNFTKLLQEIDLQVGGRHRLGMVSPEGEQHVSGGVYREIVPPQRLVMTEAWEDAEGKPGHETLVTITLDQRDDRTEMVFVQTGFEDAASRDGHREGWTEAFDALAAAFARQQERSP